MLNLLKINEEIFDLFIDQHFKSFDFIILMNFIKKICSFSFLLKRMFRKILDFNIDSEKHCLEFYNRFFKLN